MDASENLLEKTQSSSLANLAQHGTALGVSGGNGFSEGPRGFPSGFFGRCDLSGSFSAVVLPAFPSLPCFSVFSHD